MTSETDTEAVVRSMRAAVDDERIEGVLRLAGQAPTRVGVVREVDEAGEWVRFHGAATTILGRDHLADVELVRVDEPSYSGPLDDEEVRALRAAGMGLVAIRDDGFVGMLAPISSDAVGRLIDRGLIVHEECRVGPTVAGRDALEAERPAA